MVTILRHGHAQPIKYHFTCSICGCEFEITKDDNEDIKIYQTSQIDIVYNHDESYYCRCPECHKMSAYGDIIK